MGIGALVEVYVDNFVLNADSPADTRKAFKAMDEAELLGLVSNPDKDIGREGELRSIKALGLILDAEMLLAATQ